MNFTKIRSLLLAALIGLVSVVIVIGLLGMTSPLLAQEQELTEREKPFLSMAKPGIYFTVVFTDPAESLVVYDPSGNPIDEGVHMGEVRCRGDNCNKDTQIYITLPLTDPVAVEYSFSNRVAIDPEARRAVVAGTGTLNNGRQKERFSFIATFEDNRDSTVSVRYEASTPNASFVLPKSSGIFVITSSP